MIVLQSVKLRLTLWYAFVLTVILTVFSILMYAELSRVLHHDLDQTLAHEANAIEQSTEGYLSGIFKGLQLAEESRPFPYPFFQTPELRLRLVKVIQSWEAESRRILGSTLMVRVVGLDHEAILSNLTGWEHGIIFPDFERDSTFMEAGESFQTIHYDKIPIRLYYRLVSGHERPLFIIQIASSQQEVENTLRRLAFIILFSIPGAVAAACLAGWFLSKHSFRPVDMMIREARQITAAYLKGRLPRSQTGDELDRLAETLNEMMDRIEASTRAVQEFSSDISHELKTPLAIIRGEIDLALRRARSAEEHVATLKIIGGEVNELIRLVDDLMLLVRSDARQLQFEKKEVDLTLVLTQVHARFLDRAHESGIQLEIQASPTRMIPGDAVYLKRLFSNLVDNALKFTPKGGKVVMRIGPAKNGVETVIEDTGMGIEYAMQVKVFSRFYRTDQARSKEGAGLGLNIAKAICDAHGGQIDIKSVPGQGTQVRVQLPL